MVDRPPVRLAAPLTGVEEWEALREPLETGWLTQGPKVAAFEALFAERHRVGHALAVSSGTAALHVALLAVDVGPGDEVIVPAFTWVAVANVVTLCGATPVYADVDPQTYNLTPATTAAVRSDRTRAAIVVHQFGLPADVDAIRSVLPTEASVIEDAACAAGAARGDRPAGSLGDIGCFSFHPRKVLVCGEGGMVTTDDDDLAARARRLHNHGVGPGGLSDVHEVGLNYRLSELHAAVGVVQLGKLDAMIAARADLAARYQRQLAGSATVRAPSVGEGARHAWQAFVVVLDQAIDREALASNLAADGIETRPGTHSVTELPVHRERFGADPATTPVSAMLHRQSLALPLHNRMTDDDVDRVVDALLGLT